jgi:hypothetical protein
MRALVVFIPFIIGCGLNLHIVDASVRRPSNVAVYVRITDHDGKGVPGLDAAQFKLSEDGKPIEPMMSKQVLLGDQTVAAKYALLLIDMSGPIGSAGERDALIHAAAAFADRLSRTQEVALCAFDGAADIHPLVLFAAGGGVARGDLDALRAFVPSDPSDNLDGAVVAGIEALRKQMERTQQPVRLGTLVVFTDGMDHARRVTRGQLTSAIDSIHGQVSFFAVGVGPGVDAEELRAIGREGTVFEKRPTDLARAFDEITKRVDDYSRSHYLLSYCSPARAGGHELRIDVDVKHRGAGGIAYRFEADGFQPRCDSTQPPTFEAHHVNVPRRRTALR